MSLLTIDHVSVLNATADHESLILNDICLQLDAGELVAIWGKRHSGRSTLLRIACGMQSPDLGTIRFDDRRITGPDLLGHAIAYCRADFHGNDSWGVLEEIIAAQMARGLTREDAQRAAIVALSRAGANHCAERKLRDLHGADAIRGRLAMALSSHPRLLILDDAIAGVNPAERDGILLLLRELADSGIAVLSATDETTGLSGADRALSLSEGRLHGALTPQLAQVIPLRRAANA